MAKFHYSMENVLKIKEKIEEQRRMDLGQAMMKYQDEIAKAESVKVLLVNTIEAFKVAGQGRMVVSEFQRLNNSVNYYEGAMKDQNMKVQKAFDLVELKREALRRALEEKQIQEKLREKALEAFVEEEKLIEQKILDEIVSFRYSKDEE